MRTLVLLVLFVATLPGALGQTTIHTQSTSKELLLQDYDYFFSQLEQIHPDPYSAFGGKDEFDKAVKQLRDELASRGSMTLNEMQVEVTRLISALHDGHTYMEYDHATFPTHSRVVFPRIILWLKLSPQKYNCRMMSIASPSSVRMQNYCILRS